MLSLVLGIRLRWSFILFNRSDTNVLKPYQGLTGVYIIIKSKLKTHILHTTISHKFIITLVCILKYFPILLSVLCQFYNTIFDEFILKIKQQ